MKSIQLQGWYYWWKWVMKYGVEMASSGIKHLSSLKTIGCGIQVIWKLLPKQLERLQCCYYRSDLCMKNAVDGLRWRDVRTNFYDCRYRNSRNIKVVITAIWEPRLMVLHNREIYEACHWDDLRCHDVHTKLHNDRFRSSKLLRGDADTSSRTIKTYLNFFQNKWVN
jgi:hypothetical protein